LREKEKGEKKGRGRRIREMEKGEGVGRRRRDWEREKGRWGGETSTMENATIKMLISAPN